MDVEDATVSTSNASNLESGSDADITLSELIKSACEEVGEEYGDLSDDENVPANPIIEEFTNPSRLPLNQIHFETYETKQLKDFPDDLTADDLDALDVMQYFRRETVVVPALSKVFLSVKKKYNPYQTYNFDFGEDENEFYLRNNVLFYKDLDELLNYNYHRFWCHILFATELTNNILNFLQQPIFWYEYNYVDGDHFQVYAKVYNAVYKVLKRLLEFRHSEEEYMDEETIMQYLEEKKFLKLSTLINIAILYGTKDTKLVSKLFAGCTHPKRLQNFTNQVQKVIKQTLVALEMVGGYICGFEDGAKITPIKIDPKPKDFNPFWYNDAITYVLHSMVMMQTLFCCYKESIDVAVNAGLPYRMTFFYDRVFPKFHSIISERWYGNENEVLRSHILNHIVVCRGKWVQTFDNIVTDAIDNILLHVGDPSKQTKHVELYMKLITSAMEDEMFFADYHAEYHVDLQIENIRELHPEIDQMRTDFIINCIKNNSSNFKTKQDTEVQTVLSAMSTLKLGSQLNIPDIVLMKKLNSTESDFMVNGDDEIDEESEYLSRDVIENALKTIDSIPSDVLKMLKASRSNFDLLPKPSTSKSVKMNTNMSIPTGYDVNDEKIEQAIEVVANALPHLGDGFILKCLEYYNYNPTEVISAILDENLAPHLMELSFDEIRIPPEPEPPQPLHKHVGKKPFEYDDAKAFLDDKSALTKEVRETITNSYLYDDDYDDSVDDFVHTKDYSMLGRDASEIYESVVESDKLVSEPESTSEEEYDKEGIPVDSNRKDVFCEDPAVIRERREQQRHQQQRGKHPPQKSSSNQDVHGKPKGQGQDKNVLVNRDKKNVHKSSRANHNRKSGAQWKRSRAMLPS